MYIFHGCIWPLSNIHRNNFRGSVLQLLHQTCVIFQISRSRLVLKNVKVKLLEKISAIYTVYVYATCTSYIRLYHAKTKLLCVYTYNIMYTYIGIFDSGRSEIRTIFLQRTQLEVTKYSFPIVPTHFGSPKEDNLLTKDRKTASKCP